MNLKQLAVYMGDCFTAGSKDDRMWSGVTSYRPTIPRRPEPPDTTPATPRTTTAVRATSAAAPPRRPRPPTATDDKPDFCDTSFDAVSVIRKDTFFFRGKYTWRLVTRGRLYAGYPALISRMWQLPEDTDHVDAAYERLDGKIVFFVGKRTRRRRQHF